MTKQDLVDNVANGTGIPRQDVAAVVDGFLALVIDAVADGNRVELRRFGTWKTVVRKGRSFRTPDGQHTVEMPPRVAVVFMPSRDFKARLDLLDI
jgi:nucleoid DNA-binding protein